MTQSRHDKWLSAARELTRRTILIDAHIDVPFRLSRQWEDISKRTRSGDFDFPRAREGGLNAPVFAIYIPAYVQTDGRAYKLANELITLVEDIVARSPEKFALSRSPSDIVRQSHNDLISITLGLENGAAIEDDLTSLDHFFDRGIRYVTLCHARDNQICDSSFDDARTWGGLSPFGKEVVAEMNRIGLMVDVSHVSDASLEDVLEITSAPVIVSHSSARHFTPDWERNISDDLIREVAAAGGVVHINFGSMFLTPECNKAYTKAMNEVKAVLSQRGIKEDAPEGRRVYRRYRRTHELPYADVSDVADHIDHVVGIAGIDHVGIGSDFDGVGDSLPRGLKDVSQYPHLVAELLARGYGESELEKVLAGNLMRVWEAVEDHANGQ